VSKWLKSVVFTLCLSAISSTFCPRGEMYQRIKNLVNEHCLAVALRTSCPNPYVLCDGTEDGIVIWNHVMRILSEVYVAAMSASDVVRTSDSPSEESDFAESPSRINFACASSSVELQAIQTSTDALHQLKNALTFDYVRIFTPNEKAAGKTSDAFSYLITDQSVLSQYNRLVQQEQRAAEALRQETFRRRDISSPSGFLRHLKDYGEQDSVTAEGQQMYMPTEVKKSGCRCSIL